jgi:hypothetical protein
MFNSVLLRSVIIAIIAALSPGCSKDNPLPQRNALSGLRVVDSLTSVGVTYSLTTCYCKMASFGQDGDHLHRLPGIRFRSL